VSSAYLHDLTVDLLLAAEAALDPLCTGNELPPRRYVHFGEPAWDLCQGDEAIASSGQLVAWWGNVESVVTAVGNRCAVQYRAQLCVELARCYPDLGSDSQPLPPAVYEGAAAILDTDTWALVRGVGAWLAGIDCEWRAMDPVVPSGPQGGMAGVRVCVRLSLNDLDPLCTPPGP